MKLIILLLSVLCLVSCTSSSKDSLGKDEDMQVANNVSIFESQDSQKKWVLTALSVNFADLQHAILKSPKLNLKQEGRDSAMLSGDVGNFDYQEKKVSIEGHAIIKSLTENITITAESFFYDIDRDKLWSSTKTIVTRDDGKLVAKAGIETDSKLTTIEFKKQTTYLPTHLQDIRQKK